MLQGTNFKNPTKFSFNNFPKFDNGNKDGIKLKRVMEDIRDSVKAEIESLKELVERVTLKRLEQVNTLEVSLISVQKLQKTTFEKYNEYLKQLDKKFNSFLSSINIEDLLSYDFEKLDIKPTP